MTEEAKHNHDIRTMLRCLPLAAPSVDNTEIRAKVKTLLEAYNAKCAECSKIHEQAESCRRVVGHLIETRTDGECGNLDGFDLQELLEKEGILEMVTATESCGDDCPCAEFGFPAECYQLTDAGKAARGSHKAKKKKKK